MTLAGAGTAARVAHMGGVSSLLAVILAVGMWGCGGGQNNSPPPPPKITVGVLVPNYTVAGKGTLSFFVNGSGFTPSSVVQWNGTPIPTSYGTTEILTASISASLLALPGDGKHNCQGPLLRRSVERGAVWHRLASRCNSRRDSINHNRDRWHLSKCGQFSGSVHQLRWQVRCLPVRSYKPRPCPASGYQDIYLRDTCLGSAPPGCTPSTIRISVTYDGSPTNFHSYDSSVSSDGRFVGFDSEATNILPNTSICSNTCAFLRDTCNGGPTGCVPTTTLVSVTQDGTAALGANPSMSGDEFIAFNANGTSIGATGGVGEAFVRDTCFGAAAGCVPGTTLVSLSSSGDPGNERSGLPVISATGRYIAFQSWGTNLAPNVTIVPGDYWRDTCTGAAGPCTPATVRADIAMGGAQPNGPIDNNVIPAMSADGRLVAFGSGATNLVSQNVNGKGNVYLYDTCTGAPAGCVPTTSLTSLANDGSVGNCGSPSQGISMSGDGRFVAFDSIATNLVPGDGFPACGFEDIFVRDTCFGVPSGCVPSTVRASVTNQPNPETPGFSISGYPAISGDGHYVVFLSASTNLIPGGTNGHQVVFLAKTGF